MAGKQTVAATASGVSATDYFTWSQTTPAETRILTGKATGNIDFYMVVERLGNPVKDAVISLSRTGSGLFGNGASSQSITTDVAATANCSFCEVELWSQSLRQQHRVGQQERSK